MSRLWASVSVLLLLTATAASAQTYGEQLEGPDSLYTERLVRVLRLWSPRHLAKDAQRSVEMTCVATPGEDAYVGIVRRTAIHASLISVEEVLDDVAHFKDLFPGTADVQIVPGTHNGNRFATAWEQRVPVFLLPNVAYQLSHVVDKTTPGMGVYRYKLRHSGQLSASDGIVVLEAVSRNLTHFTEYGFFLPSSNLVPASLVWRESAKAAFLSNVSIRLKAEHPDWSYGRVAEESQRLLPRTWTGSSAVSPTVTMPRFETI